MTEPKFVTHAELQAVVDDVSKLGNATVETLANLIDQHTANTLVLTTIVAMLAKDLGLDKAELMEFIAENSPRPEVTEHARALIGGRPKFVVIQGGKK